MQNLEIPRPLITKYKDMRLFVADMLEFRKSTDRSFSVHNACKHLRRISPTLISLIVKGQRRITSDRIEELAQLLRLTVSEKFYFKNLIQETEVKDTPYERIQPKNESLNGQKKNVTTHILNDWINVYVKDCFQIANIRANPQLIYEYLKPIASRKRIEKALNFLLREGHLRKLLDGTIVPEVNLTVTDPKISSAKIRKFHKSSLKIASSALDLYSIDERLANLLLIPLSKDNYQEFLHLIEEFALKLQEFAAQQKTAEQENPKLAQTRQLYQFLLNLSPVGGIST